MIHGFRCSHFSAGFSVCFAETCLITHSSKSVVTKTEKHLPAGYNNAKYLELFKKNDLLPLFSLPLV